LPAAFPLVIVGDGPLRERLEAAASASHLNNIRFSGRLPRNEVYKAMKKAAFLIVPSLWNEPFGLVLAEAFACGIPVLGARVGAIPEMLEHEVTGLHFTPDDPDDIAKKVAWAWEHQAELAVMGHSARRVYEGKYTARANYRLLMEIYASAIDGTNRKRAIRTAA